MTAVCSSCFTDSIRQGCCSNPSCAAYVERRK